MGRFMKECCFALVVGPSHAVPEHSHRAGSSGDIICLDVAVPVLCLLGRQWPLNRLILLGSAVWVALVLLNWGVSFFVV